MKLRHTAFRNLFLFLLLANVLVTAASAQTAKPTPVPKPTIVIVHGAWGGSWAWRKVDAMLREKGFDVYRPQLTGLG
jgi:pimeloyl-ACP methyl ester carboxylesterase